MTKLISLLGLVLTSSTVFAYSQTDYNKLVNALKTDDVAKFSTYHKKTTSEGLEIDGPSAGSNYLCRTAIYGSVKVADYLVNTAKVDYNNRVCEYPFDTTVSTLDGGGIASPGYFITRAIPLHKSPQLRQKAIKIFNIIVKKPNFDPNIKTLADDSILNIASAMSVPQIVTNLLKLNSIDVNLPGINGERPVETSIGEMHWYWKNAPYAEQVFNILINDKRVELNHPHRISGYSHFRSFTEGIIQAREELLNNPNAQYSKKMISMYDRALVKLSGREDFNVDKEEGGRTSLMMATELGLKDVVQKLVLRKNINISARSTKDGKNAYELAIENGYPEIAEIILNHSN